MQQPNANCPSCLINTMKIMHDSKGMTTLVNQQLPSVSVNIRSDDIEVYSADQAVRSDLTFVFNRSITIPSGIKTLITVSSLQLPHSFYNIPSDTTLVWTIGGAVFSTIVTKGTYSASAWNATLAALFTAAGATNAPVFILSPITLKQQVLTPAAQWSLDSASHNGTQVLRQFGATEFPFGSAENWTSPQAVDATGSHNVYVASGFNTGSLDSNAGQRSNILCKVPINAPFGSMIQYNGDPSISGILLDVRAISRIRLVIVDHEGIMLDLNGVRWNASVLLQFVVSGSVTGGKGTLAERLPIVTQYRKEVADQLLEKRAKIALRRLDTVSELDAAIGRDLPVVPE